MTATMSLRVNGERRDEPAGTTVARLVAGVLPAAVGDDGRPRGVAVAVGETVVPRQAWESTELCDGDVVEIVSATPGG